MRKAEGEADSVEACIYSFRLSERTILYSSVFSLKIDHYKHFNSVFIAKRIDAVDFVLRCWLLDRLSLRFFFQAMSWTVPQYGGYRDYSVFPGGPVSGTADDATFLSMVAANSQASFPVKLHRMLETAVWEGLANIVGWEVHGR